MQYTEDIERINFEEVEELSYEEVKQKAEISWVFIQVVICILVLSITLLLRALAPEIYSGVTDEYSKIIEENILIEDGEIKIVNE